jgi:hypothetical protein
MPLARSTPASRERFTFRGNVADTRYGWLRLTPAYSVQLVRELLDSRRPTGRVLDPFCGTGTTLLACRELSLDCDTVDLNPFLLWLTRAKTRDYAERDRQAARRAVAAMATAATQRGGPTPWIPDLYRIDRWWTPATCRALGRALAKLHRARTLTPAARDLALLAFSRTLIETAQVSFGHQSMSFRRHGRTAPRRSGGRAVAAGLQRAIGSIAAAAEQRLPRTRRRIVRGDSRGLHQLLGQRRYAAVITSPPYSNRMSYIRELRPYMYWLGYLTDRRSAGELDWSVIGGTWGVATSRLLDWKPARALHIPYDGFDELVAAIATRSEVLARYVARYFHDMALHLGGLHGIVAPGGHAYYVIGNSKFYDVVLPAEEIFRALFTDAGFVDTQVQVLRKRTSKAELFEYLVSATRP